MSWFGSNEISAKSSEFLTGENIVTRMQNSFFGRIKDTVKSVFGTDLDKEYRLPKVIVIGNESSGKSCLLENITKCQIFPRDAKQCTKCPVHLKLNNSTEKKYVLKFKKLKKVFTCKEHIYNEIKKIMNTIPDDEILQEEIIVEFNEPNLPVFEFVDLPGIVEFPEKRAKLTVQLSNKYLNDKNTIVLCVVPATVTRLTSCKSIALIKAAKMESKCILALTMADRVQPINLGDLLISRVLKSSNEFKELNFNGCISVVNRLHTDEYSLEENDKKEIEWFTNNIYKHVPITRTNDLINIKENTTIINLIKKVDLLYNIHIEKEWKPNVLKKINHKKELLIEQQKKLGNNITSGLLEDFLHKIKYEMSESYKSIIFNQYYLNKLNLKPDASASTRFYAVKKLISDLNEETIINIAKDILIKKLEKMFNNTMPMVSERLVKFKTEIYSEIIRMCRSKWADNASLLKTSLENILVMISINYYDNEDESSIEEHEETNSSDVLDIEFTKLIKIMILDFVVENFNLKITQTHMEESDDYKKQRHRLNENIIVIDTHFNKISALKTSK